MIYIEGFRNPKAAAALSRRIAESALTLEEAGRKVRIMEVCGSHTMAIGRYGIRDLLPENVHLVSGPGCPVCVTSAGYIDAAIELAERGSIVVTFGDMLHVPGSDSSLAACRAAGHSVEVVYSPAIALDVATKNPDREVVFLAIGFETTTAPVVSLVESCIATGVDNLSLLAAFKTVPPALAALVVDEELGIDAFLCPAHVSAIIGSQAYDEVANQYGLPCVIAGFEPLDILLGVHGILEQLISGEPRVDNQYSRVVRPEGNKKAQTLIDRYLVPVDAHWRGIGVIPLSGLGLRPAFAAYDAEKKHDIEITAGVENPGCLCGDVIKGKCSPSDCPMFGTACTPDSAVGPCMVSSEGSCAAYFKYSR